MVRFVQTTGANDYLYILQLLLEQLISPTVFIRIKIFFYLIGLRSLYFNLIEARENKNE